MTTHNTSPNAILEAARKLQQERMDTVTALAQSRAEVAEAERVDALNYAAALKAGWTEAELKSLHLDPPARRAPGRPRRKSTKDRVADGELGVGALLGSVARREAEASVALDRDETHVVGEPAA